MTQYIDKSAVVAEIERIMAEEMSFFEDCCKDELENTSSPVVYTRMEMILSFLNTLEVKEVDEEYNGKAMLHVLEKGVKQGKRELIDKACKWWEEELSYPSMPQKELKWVKCKAKEFRKAMEE